METCTPVLGEEEYAFPTGLRDRDLEARAPASPVAPRPRSGRAAFLERELAETYHQLAAGLFHYALHLAQRREAAEDIVQEVFLRYFQTLQAGEAVRNKSAWLYRVTRNCFLAGVDRPSARNEVPWNEDAIQGAGYCDAPEDRYHAVRFLRELLGLLSPREAEVVQLRAEGLEYSEIAEVLGLRVGTVGALLTRAMDKCRRFAA